ncbi:MAG: hypothetical protein R3C20_18995 [Planctomycetaceae bacterium]
MSCRCLAAVIASGLIQFTLAGCSPSTEPPAAPPTPPSSDATGTGGLETGSNSNEGASDSVDEFQEFDGMKFLVPASWESMELSGMQKGIIAAKFSIPSAGDDVSLTLSTSGGSLEDNIRRWQGQFSGGPDIVTESIKADGQDATVVRLQGTFSPGFGRPSQDGYAMTGVVIPMGQTNYYIKLTGPIEGVSSADAEFIEFCKSARRG